MLELRIGPPQMVIYTKWLFTDLNDLFRFHSLIPRAAFGIQEAKKLLQNVCIRRIPKVSAFALDLNQALVFQLFQMVKQKTIL